MRLKNFLIVVEDIEVSKAFYHDLFGLDVVTDFGENVILTGGLVLQERKLWEEFIAKEVTYGGHDAELYFEEKDLDGFMQRIEKSPYSMKYVHPIMEHSWGQRVIRIYDPDGHMIEIGEPVR